MESGAQQGRGREDARDVHFADVRAYVSYEDKDMVAACMEEECVTERTGAITLGGTPTAEEIEQYTRSLESPGEIQSHGWLLVVDENYNCVIRAATDNSFSLFGLRPEELLGRHLASLFVERERIDSAVAMSDLSLANPLSMTMLPVANAAAAAPERKVNLILHRSKSGLLVDIEALDVHSMGSFAAHQRVRLTIERLNVHTDMVAMSQQVVEEVFNTTGHSRVMMYKFHEDMHGEVIAECKSQLEEDAWLGLHFPATDLPQRSRDQLIEEHVRLIADAQEAPAKIITDKFLEMKGGSQCVDLKGSTLRSPHRCHREYLANMRVRGTLVLAVLLRNQLWGLVVCHDANPRSVSYQTRMACEFLAQALSMRLASLVDMEVHRRHERSLQLHAKLCEYMYKHGPGPLERLRGLVSSTPNLTHLVAGISSAAVVYSGQVLIALADGGDAEQTPAIEKHVHQLVSVLVSQKPQVLEDDALAEVVVVNSLVDEYGESLMGELAPSIAGMLAVRILQDGWLLLLRPEVAATIHWSGDPRAAARRTTREGGASVTMHPRASFSTYKDSVKRHCQPWLMREVEDLIGLGRMVQELISQGSGLGRAVGAEGGREAEGSGLGGGRDLRSEVLVQLNSERMKTRNAREAALTEMSFLIDSVKAPVLGMDNMGLLVQWNAMLAKLTGYSRDEVLGLSIANYVPNSSRAPLKDAVRRAIKGEEVEGVELSIIKANAVSLPTSMRRVDLRVNVSARFNAAGVCTGVVCVGLDVTATNAARGRQAELEQQMDAVLHMTSASDFTTQKTDEAPETNFTFEPSKEASFLGEGSFAKTYKMRGSMDGQLYAVKMINVKKAEKNGVQLDALKREVHMLMRLNSPHIIRYYTCYMYRKGKYLCIVMELAEGGSLGDLIEDTRGTVSRLSEARVRTLVTQVAKGIQHIHSKRMLHRDIKPNNILLTPDGSEAKITDFGLACILSSAVASSRAGTLAYSSAEKAGARGYDAKDDMWAVGCILSELLTNTPIPSRCGGGVFSLNPALVSRTIEDSLKASANLGRVVAHLLVTDPEKRPTATELLAILEPGPQLSSFDVDDAEELCEEYLCAICQNLVLDAHTVCQDEHVFCRACLLKWLDTKNECPTCRKEAEAPHRLRIINNAVEKLANRVLDDKAKRDRAERKAALVAEQEARDRAEAQVCARQVEEQALRDAGGAYGYAGGAAGAAAAPEARASDVRLTWKYSQGQAQFGARCTLFKHILSGLIVEVFHGNGWYRFRTERGGPTRWCNSCGNLGQSDFGAANAVALLEDGGGEHVPEDARGLLDDSGYWESRIASGRIELRNSDDEALILSADGLLVWLSHPGINKAVVIRQGVCSTCQRNEGTSLLE